MLFFETQCRLAVGRESAETDHSHQLIVVNLIIVCYCYWHHMCTLWGTVLLKKNSPTDEQQLLWQKHLIIIGSSMYLYWL